MKASDLFVRCLENEGVRYIFGVPGEENLDFLESLRTSSIQLIITRHEQSAAFMAATYGRLTGRAGVALSTLGPGATNLVTGVAFAQLGGMPLVVITGQKPIKQSKQGRFQVIDVVGMMRPITKMTERVSSGGRIPSLVREAFRLAEEERPGAVHLELPEDIAAELVERTPLTRTGIRRPGPDPKALETARRMIQNAKHPLIIIANGANRKRVRKHLHEFIEKTKMPFVSTQMGKGVIDERSPYSIGASALSDTDYVHCALAAADLLIVVGHDVMEKPPAFINYEKQKLLHINFYSAHTDDVYLPTAEVVGDIAHTLWALTEKIEPQEHWDLSYFFQVRDSIRLMGDSGSPSFPLKPQYILAALRRVIQQDGILSLDNGMYKLWVTRHYPAYEQNTVLIDNAFATMGAGLPNAIAAKLLNPDRPVVALCGDGGFMMNSQEIETAMRLGLNLVVVIVNDNGFGMIQWKQEAQHMPSFGLTFTNPDFVKYAESYGARGYRVMCAEELEQYLSRALEEKGVTIIDCPIDYSENIRVLTNELAAKVCPV
ncbi:MAG: acetolactate synthase large subunit [Candidatus Uhrbacteria bacterium]|nr:acetolactate synthase large subunit [Candidatus Uhrbacteria bacterium]